MQIVMGATQLKIFELLRTASTPEDAEVIQEVCPFQMLR